MDDALRRKFEVGEQVYVVDYWGTGEGTRAFSFLAEILEVIEKREIFTVVLCGDTYQTYSYNDYDRLVFDTREEANNAANQLPRPQTVMYQRIGDRVYKKKVTGISGHHVNGTYDLVVRMNKWKEVSIKEIGKTLFFNEEDARK